MIRLKVEKENRNSLLHLEGRDLSLMVGKPSVICLVRNSFPGMSGQQAYTIFSHDSTIVVEKVYEALCEAITSFGGVYYCIIDVKELANKVIEDLIN